MKKLVALLLVLCMVVGLVACGKPDSGKDGTTGATNATTGSNNGGDNDGNNGGSTSAKNNDDLIDPDKFGGKTLQLYGFSSAAFEDIEEMGYGSYIWMMRAAIDEWAYLNNVTIEFEGDYEQNALLGAINSGAKPDMFLHCDKFPQVANLGITRALTEDEYNQLVSICGSTYVDMMNYKGESHGVNYPWSGCSLFYYNKTMFEEYGEKTPKEYYMEDNWTWETMEKCLEAVTKDLDGDGKKDTYGSGWIWNLIGATDIDSETGKMSLLLDDPAHAEKYRKWLDMEYKGYNVTGSLGAYGDCDVATNPRPGTHIGDAELYNYAHLNQTLVNGDVIETIPTPLYNYETERSTGYTPAFMSILSTCDEPEATLALMSYILRVGMAYMDEFSVGLYECDYEGMRGATEYSQGWKDNFAWIVEERQAEFDALEDWDAELYAKMFAEVEASKKRTGGTTAVPADNSIQNDVKDLPSASAYPIVYQKYKAIVDKYNGLYAN